MNIIGYTYEADQHCVTCTKKRFEGCGDATNGFKDEHGLHKYQKDGEENLVRPMFSTDEQLETPFCGTCHAVIE